MLDMLKAKRAQLKKEGKKGFTLMEMLIVVAIIAVLVAIMIPVMTNQLEKSREAADAANVRSAYASVTTCVLTDPQKDTSDGIVKYNTSTKKYTATVSATQKNAKWQTNGDAEKMDIGGQQVAASTLKGWTITGDPAAGTVTIEEAA